MNDSAPISSGPVAAPPQPERIGLFGGAFDPPHDAHVALARACVEQLELTRLIVTPTGKAWHKARTLSPDTDRLAMARLAFAELPRVCVDDREMRRPGASYTIDTLTELRAEHPGACLLLQLGADQAAALPSWHRYTEILQIATISVAVRDAHTRASAGFDPDHPPPALAAGRFVRLHLPAMPHSSTAVRERVAAGLPIDHLVPNAVARYIAAHHLYPTNPAAE